MITKVIYQLRLTLGDFQHEQFEIHSDNPEGNMTGVEMAQEAKNIAWSQSQRCGIKKETVTGIVDLFAPSPSDPAGAFSQYPDTMVPTPPQQQSIAAPMPTTSGVVSYSIPYNEQVSDPTIKATLKTYKFRWTPDAKCWRGPIPIPGFEKYRI